MLANGGALPYTYKDTGTTLPTGMTIDLNSGVISVTAVTSNTTAFPSGQTVSITVTDANGLYTVYTFTLVIS
jgi:hypothetical protein